MKESITVLSSNKMLQNCMDECSRIEVHKHVAYKILDSVTVQLDARFGDFENMFFVELQNEKKIC